jgi:mannonate dehydratase
MPLRDLADATLNFYRQIGVEAVTVPQRYNETKKLGPIRPLVPPAQQGPPPPPPRPWDPEELGRICHRIASFGLCPDSIDLPLSDAVLLDLPGRAADLERIKSDIGIAATAGIRTLTCNFTALRASEGYDQRRGAGRGGAHLRDFDAARLDGLPPLPAVGVHSREQMWDRLEVFLKAAVPAAETAGVRLAMHPNDPPLPVYRGVAQPLDSLAAMLRLTETIDSPANSIFFDSGVATEWGADAVEVARLLGQRDRIGMVHLRNVRREEPVRRYVETFIDEGQADIAACIRALAAVDYRGGVDPDHTPGLDGDGEEGRQGWAYAVAYIRALRAQTLV